MSDNNNFNINNPKDDERIDDFLSRLRQSGALDDMDREEKPLIRTSSFEKAREPVPPSVNSDVVLYRSDEEERTTVFRKNDVANTKSSSGKSKSGTTDLKKNGDTKPNNAKPQSGNKKKKRKPEKTPWWKKLLKACLYTICILAVGVCVAAIVLSMYLGKETADDEELLDLNAIKLSYATVILYTDPETGETVEYDRLFENENRIWKNYEDFPQVLKDVVVASEDHGFWDNRGVDIKRTVAATATLVLEKLGIPSPWAGGGSTITQQLIKNITEERTTQGTEGVLRKIREIYRAYQLDRRFTKEQIMEAYLNTFGVGGQVAGIESGANYYFGKTTEELTAAESAAIVCITKYPNWYDPFIDPEENRIQRNWILDQMYQLGTLTESEYRAALEESNAFVFDAPKSTAGVNTGSQTSYFTDMVIEDVLTDLVEIAGYTSAEAYDLLFNGGLRIITTMDPAIQETVEKVALDEEQEIWPELELIEPGDEEAGENDEFVGQPKKNQIQAAIVVMDYEGHILGVAGGIRGKEGSRVLNRAAAPRQTGSSMKPIGVYGPAIEYGRINFSTLFADVPTEVINGQEWPRNYSWTYNNPVTVAEGIATSLNTTAVQALKYIGYDTSFNFVQINLGITTLADNEVQPDGSIRTDRGLGPMALGSLTYGISPIDMCAAYAIFGNDGTYTEPHCYTMVIDARDNIIIDKAKAVTRNQAITPQTSMIMNRLMQGVMTIGTGTNARPRNTDLVYAGKSGTTSDNRDFWFIGLNPYYVCAVWEGYDEPEYMITLRPHPTQLAFRAVMTEISQDLETKAFPVAEGVVTRTFCMDSGEIAGPACGRTRLGYYVPTNLPGGVCDGAAMHPAPLPPEE